MARPTNPKVKEPKDPAEYGDTVPKESDDPKEKANLEGWTGKDGSKSLGHAKQPPVADESGLGADADDAGRTEQEKGSNTGSKPQRTPTQTTGI
jgi:hypothetical protein